MKQTARNAFGFGQGGFTMIEVVAVLVIIGIVSAVAAVRMSGTSSYDLASQVEVVKGHLRYAQTRAMNSNLVVWGINFNSTTTYYLFQGVGSTTPVLLPGEDSATISLTAKKSALTITPVRITFNEFGSPCAASGTPPAPLTADATVTTNGGTITVTKNTGFMP
jgi:prepilin-type N-terminal cleavage/methylation domain-containing protein